MNRLHTLLIPAILAGFLLITSTAHAQQRSEATVAKAMAVLNELGRDQQNGLPRKVLQSAVGIAIIPDQFTAGFFLGARWGRGLLIVRQDDGTWSNPVFISTYGGSYGFQAGAQATDLILVFRGRKSVDSFLKGKGKLTMGVDASVAAGPLGRRGEASTDLRFRSEILSYSRNRGVFAGIAAGGGSLHIDKKVNAEYYGRPVTPGEILATPTEVKPPASALDLKRMIADRTEVPREAKGNGKPRKAPATKIVEEEPETKVEGALPAREPGDEPR